ncbi:hypothetical protein GKC56_05460 [Neisseriaceae bacterium PsAf]|nr:hypothetical protein [Neisseriaceae bacterium PsAf]
MKKELFLFPLLAFSLNVACAKPYVETKADQACYDNAQGNFQDIADCVYNSADKVQANLQKKIKKLNKQNVYTDKWLKDARAKIEKNCKSKFYQDGDYITYTKTAECVRDNLSALEDKIK